MFSIIFTAIFAVGLICTVSCIEPEHTDPYKALIKCGQYSLQRDEDNLRANRGHWSSQKKLDESCISLVVRVTVYLSEKKYMKITYLNCRLKNEYVYEPEKNSGLYGNRTHETSAIPVQRSNY